MKRLFLVSVFSFLTLESFSVSYASLQEEQPLLCVNFKNFTKQQWMKLDVKKNETKNLIEEAAKYYKERQSEFGELKDLLKPSCCISKKAPEIVQKISKKIEQLSTKNIKTVNVAIQANDCFTSPQIYTLTNEKDKKKAQKFQTGILRRVSDENFGILSNTHLVEVQNHQKELKIEELQNTIVQQQSQFELFKTQIENSLAKIVEKKVEDILSQQKVKDQEMLALTQTVTRQQEEIKQLRQIAEKSDLITLAQTLPNQQQIDEMKQTLIAQESKIVKLEDQISKIQIAPMQTTEVNGELMIQLKSELEILKSKQLKFSQNFIEADQIGSVVEKVMSTEEIVKMQKNLEEVTKLARSMSEGTAAEKKANFNYVLRFAYLVKALVDAKEQEMDNEAKDTWKQLVAKTKTDFEKAFGIQLK